MALQRLSLILYFVLVTSHAALGYAVKSCSSNLTTYDFIVIGGGTAGLAVATRLSQGLTTCCILVVEAGSDGRAEPRITVPGRSGSTFGSIYDWNMSTIPQSGLNNGRKISYARGKVLGGSSALNLMAWQHAAVADFDAWEALGNPGWNWKNMFANMLKVENFQLSPEYDGTKGVGTGGPIHMLINRILLSQQLAFKPTLNVLGIADNNHSLAGNPIGVWRTPTNLRPSDYSRSYSVSYLDLAKANLALLMNTRVAKINFNHRKVATGITLTSGQVIHCSKEVILSAGTFQSPGLLELSGIGSPQILKAASIPIIYNNSNVGENLQDHPRIQSSYQLKPEYQSFDVFKWNTTYAAEELVLYNKNETSLWDYNGSGYSYMSWSTLSSAIAASMLRLARVSADPSSNVDQMKLSHLVHKSASVPQLEMIYVGGLNSVKGYPAVNSSLYRQGFFSLICAIQHPFARGSVHISSSNISVNPVIDAKYLSNPYDLAAAVNAAKFMRKVATTYPMSATWTSEYEPGPAVQTGADWESSAKNSTLTINHPVGTCPMLPRQSGGVVDPELKVYGVTGVRVVDASIMPTIPSTHMQTAVYGIAERAAELIINSWSVHG